MHGLWENVTEKEIVIIVPFDHFAQGTNELDLVLSPRFLKRCTEATPI